MKPVSKAASKSIKTKSNRSHHEKLWDLLIIGAGPAGLMAAHAAASQGASVLVLEKNASAGQKLLLSGGGRCNLSHKAALPDFLKAFRDKKQQRFIRPALSILPPDKSLQLFKNAGLPCFTQDDGRVFPCSEKASDVVQLLLRLALESGAEILYNRKIEHIVWHEATSQFHLDIFSSDESLILRSKFVLLACGGATFPHTGSDGGGYRLAASFGHQIVKPTPALIALNINDAAWSQLAGLTVHQVKLCLKSDEKTLACESGDLLITHFGLSGPAALHLSRELASRDPLACHYLLYLFPEKTREAIEQDILSYCHLYPKKNMRSYLLSILPASLAKYICERIWPEAEESPQAAHLSREERHKLADILHALPLQPGKSRALKEGMLTRGGVSLSEVHANDLSSRLQRGLYFAGEILDIDAISGGYNLQAAFSCGYLAGMSIAKNKGRHSVPSTSC